MTFDTVLHEQTTKSTHVLTAFVRQSKSHTLLGHAKTTVCRHCRNMNEYWMICSTPLVRYLNQSLLLPLNDLGQLADHYCQSCPSLELVSPLQVTYLPPVWDLLLPLA